MQLHLGWYPLMEPRDVYKLLYQGAMGAEHLHTSEDEFTQRLVSEYEKLDGDIDVRLFEPVRFDGFLFRVNLRAYKSRYQELNQLIPCLLQTNDAVHGPLDSLISDWRCFVAACQEDDIKNFKPGYVNQFSLWLEEKGYTAIHHSDIYRQNYQPAYRLISSEFVHMLGLDHES